MARKYRTIHEPEHLRCQVVAPRRDIQHLGEIVGVGRVGIRDGFIGVGEGGEAQLAKRSIDLLE
jgi:hypothetical protein